MAKVYEVERDRFGLMFSGEVEVGECIEFVRRDEHEAETQRLEQALDDTMRRAYAAEGAQDLALERENEVRKENERLREIMREAAPLVMGHVTGPPSHKIWVRYKKELG